MTAKTYKFRTFQELVDRIPADKIRECLSELGHALGATKAAGEMAVMLARDMAEKDGKTLPPLPERIIELTDEFEWIDDGKGTLDCGLLMPDGKPLMDFKITKAGP